MECKVSGQFHYVTLIPMFTDTRTTKCKQLEQVQESGNAQLCWKKSNNYGRRKHAKCYPHLVLSTFYCFITNPLAVAICGNAWMRKTPSDFPLGFSLLCTTFGLLPSRKIWFTNKQHCGELGAHRPGNLLARFHLFSQFSDEKPKSATEKTNSPHFSNTSANVRLQKTNFFARKCVLRKRKESLGKRKIRITRHTKVSSTTNATKMKGFAPSATDCLKVFPLGVASCEKDILPTAMSGGKGGKSLSSEAIPPLFHVLLYTFESTCTVSYRTEGTSVEYCEWKWTVTNAFGFVSYPWGGKPDDTLTSCTYFAWESCCGLVQEGWQGGDVSSTQWMPEYSRQVSGFTCKIGNNDIRGEFRARER